MTAQQPPIIRCSACGSLNHFTAQICERCKMPLADERNAFRSLRGSIPEPETYTDESPRAPVDPRTGAAPSQGNPMLLPYEPVVVKPDPFIGPIFRRTVRYYLSHSAVEVRSGILSKSRRQVEMYRIGSREGDMFITQGPLQRMKGTGTLVIRSSDPDMPHLALRDIHEPDRVQAQIRYNAALAQKERSPLNLGGDFHGISDF